MTKSDSESVSGSVMSDSLQPYGLQELQTLWTISLLCLWGFSRQEYWHGLPCPPPWDLPDPGTKPKENKNTNNSALLLKTQESCWLRSSSFQRFLKEECQLNQNKGSYQAQWETLAEALLIRKRRTEDTVRQHYNTGRKQVPPAPLAHLKLQTDCIPKQVCRGACYQGEQSPPWSPAMAQTRRQAEHMCLQWMRERKSCGCGRRKHRDKSHSGCPGQHAYLPGSGSHSRELEKQSSLQLRI